MTGQLDFMIDYRSDFTLPIVYFVPEWSVSNGSASTRFC